MVYVSLPKMIDPGGKFCGLLNKAMNGTRDGALNWGEDLSETLESRLKSCVFRRGQACPCTYYDEAHELRAVAHTNDILVSGPRPACQLLMEELMGVYEFTFETLGHSSEGGVMEMTILNRIIRWTPEGYELEADPRLAEGNI